MARFFFCSGGLLVMACFLSGCRKDEVVAIAPTLSTSVVTNVTASSATSGGVIASNGGADIKEKGIVWSITAAPTISLSTKTSEGAGSDKFNSSLTALVPATKYFVRAYATNSAGTAYGNELSFTTSSGIPTVNTVEIKNITSTGATSGGTIISNGGPEITARGIVWDINRAPVISLSTKTVEDGDSFASNLTGLKFATKYYVRAYATSSAGTTYGIELSFTTSSILPTVTTCAMTNITSTRAISGGTISSNGGADIIVRGLVWSLNPNPVVSLTSKTFNGNGSSAFAGTLTGLSRAMKYYVRAYATNSVGTAYGEERSFTTNAYPVLFSKLYADATVYAMSQTSDEGFIIAGNISFNSNGYGSYLMKTDSLGVEEWHTSVEAHTNTAHLGNVFQTSDGGYVLSNEVSIQRFDRNGTNLWVSPSSSYFITYNSVVEAGDGGYLVVGVSGESFQNKGIILKLGSNGNVLWTKYLDASSITTCTYIIKSPDGNFMVVGGAGLPYSTTLAVVKIDSNGNTLWLKQYAYDKTLVISIAVKIKQVDSDTFVINSTTADYSGGLSTRILTIDQNGIVKWDKSMSNIGMTCRSFTSMSNGGYIITGKINSNAIIVKLDNLGNQVWIKLLTPNNNYSYSWEFYEVVETRGRTLTFVGYRWTDAPQAADRGLWLTRTDSNGEY